MIHSNRQGYLVAVVVAVLGFCWPVAATDLFVEALLPGRAVVMIDGQRYTLLAGERVGEIVLIEADGRSGLFSLSGKTERLTVSRRIQTQFTIPDRREVRVVRDIANQYRIQAEINGSRTEVMIDTGANTVAMNSADARRFGVARISQNAVQLETAGGMINGWRAQIARIDVGGIVVQNVDAVVTEGDFPTTILLGMSYLNHVDLNERNGVLLMTREW